LFKVGLDIKNGRAANGIEPGNIDKGGVDLKKFDKRQAYGIGATDRAKAEHPALSQGGVEPAGRNPKEIAVSLVKPRKHPEVGMVLDPVEGRDKLGMDPDHTGFAREGHVERPVNIRDHLTNGTQVYAMIFHG
jgi:hypothetical protein